MTTFYLIRHGNTEVGDRIVGRRKGVHLSRTGREQADDLARRLESIRFSAVFCSPRERTQETALPFARGHGLAVSVLEALDEIEFGEWTDMTFEALERMREWKLFHTFRSATRPPGGELMIEVQTRMVAAVERLRRQFPGGAVALVSHGDPLRCVISYYAGIALDLMLRITVDTASVSVVTINDEGAVFFCMNHTGTVPHPPENQ
jgi:broad specificity phosphatase PhoE